MTGMILSQPSAIPEIGAIVRIAPYRKNERDRRRDQDEQKRKKKNAFQDLLDKELDFSFGDLEEAGSTFEARA